MSLVCPSKIVYVGVEVWTTFNLISQNYPDRLGGVVVERPPHVREDAGLIPGRVLPKTFKIVLMAALIGA